MILLWLLVWLFSGTPHLEAWNAWLIALIVCVLIDVTGGSSRA